MTYELKDWLNSINQSKLNIMDEDPSSKSEYNPYVINRCLSGFVDTIMYSNEMNMNPQLDKKLQYDFFLNSIRTRKRFSPWLRKEEIKDIEAIKSYYGYSNEKAKQSLSILNKEQIEHIKSKLDVGGKK
jgi:hypothetical protein